MNHRTSIALHLVPPIALAAYGLVSSLRRESLTVELLALQLLGNSLFFGAPYLLWLAVATGLRTAGLLWHLGFLLLSVLLVAVAVSPIFGRDPSGLPYHWLVYWPVAFVLLLPVALAAFIRRRRHAA
jgi:hypothetical protein